MSLWRYVFGIWLTAAAWTFAAALVIASQVYGASPRAALRWPLLWLYALPAMLLVSSASAFSYLPYRNAPTSHRSAGIFLGAALLSGVLGFALTELLVGRLGR